MRLFILLVIVTAVTTVTTVTTATAWWISHRKQPSVDTFAMPEEVLPLEAFQEREERIQYLLTFLSEEYPTYVQDLVVMSCTVMGTLKEEYFQKATQFVSAFPAQAQQINTAANHAWTADHGVYECFISSEQQQAEISLRRQLKIAQHFVTLQGFKDLQALVKDVEIRLRHADTWWSAVIPLAAVEGFASAMMQTEAEVLRDANGQPLARLDADVQTMSGPMLLQFTDAFVRWFVKTTTDSLNACYGITKNLLNTKPSLKMEWMPAPALAPAPVPR